MIICGIKPTHDGAIALIDSNRLIFSFEMEKLKNNSRHKEFCLTLNEISELLEKYEYKIGDVDEWVLDGWSDNFERFSHQKTNTFFGEGMVNFKLAEYGHLVNSNTDLLKSETYSLKSGEFVYKSYLHVSSHIFGAYCSSPFSKNKEDSYILVWDGGMPPQLFYYDYSQNKATFLAPLFYLLGSIYVDFPHRFEPYCNFNWNISTAGKLMAYIALGEARDSIIIMYQNIYRTIIESVDLHRIKPKEILKINQDFIDLAKNYCDETKSSHQGMLTSFHYFLQELLVSELKRLVSRINNPTKNLCFAGGSALNIKWNSAIRNAGIFKNVWVPPFPNDSGSAIGTACCAMMLENTRSLDWNVYCGPDFEGDYTELKNVDSKKCSVQELASLIHKTDEPVLFLNGNAEIGPRALGNRSILASASSQKIKSLLNKIKMREDYRPVAPICLEEDAPRVFDPGTPDPYMLFQHDVRESWKEKVPAIVHLDGSSRLQTVNRQQNEEIYDLLKYYKEISGIPLLCNTSANFKGRGFFPDLNSALTWGRVKYIWSHGKLYSFEKTGPVFKSNFQEF